MIRSMTGFGAAATEVDGARYVVELRSLNSKYFKALIRLPEELQGLEAQLEPALAQRLGRGSVVMTVRFSGSSVGASARINAEALQGYLAQLRAVAPDELDPARIDLGAILSLPGVVIAGTGEELLQRAAPVLLRLVDEACDKVLAMRSREGRTTLDQLHEHCRQIADRLTKVAQRAPVVVEHYQKRLQERINALLAESGSAIGQEDLIREVAVYAERSDISEEVSRLQGHLQQFAEILNAEEGEPAGRTLDFLSQEMLREANTIASKCLDIDISREIVQIKGAIDRIKEQVQNVE
ncbi:MAG: YicC family protein [Planctomycetes bacterium]|nr:YicC family protein [Planctomycetota bacterium]